MATPKRRRRPAARRRSARREPREPGGRPTTAGEPWDVFAADPRITAAHHRALDAALHTYGGRPGVTGVDLGFELKRGVETGEIAVRVHVREKIGARYLSPGERLPRKLHGVPVDVVQAHYTRGYGAATGGRRVRRDTIQPGVSISHPLTTAGTLGMLAADANGGALGLVSASHVLAPDGSQPGDPIVQPGRADGGLAPGDTVATLGRFDGVTDTAVAWLTAARPSSPALFGSSVVLRGSRYPVLGDVLAKSGRSTGETSGRVDGIGHYSGVGFSFRLVPLGDAPGPMSLDGDSGAAWYDAATSEAVGIHSLGPAFQETETRYAVASSVVKAFARLGLKMADQA